jgi:hypothetical protein
VDISPKLLVVKGLAKTFVNGHAPKTVAAIGGHLRRKADGFLGTRTIWRGLARLYGAAEMYAIMTEQFYPNPI